MIYTVHKERKRKYFDSNLDLDLVRFNGAFAFILVKGLASIRLYGQCGACSFAVEDLVAFDLSSECWVFDTSEWLTFDLPIEVLTTVGERGGTSFLDFFD